MYYSNLRVNLITATCGYVSKDWGEVNEHPDVNKLYLILEGEGSVTCNKTEYYPEVGDIMFVPKGSLNSYATNKDKPYKKYWCHFDADILSTDIAVYLSFPLLVKNANKKISYKLFAKLVKYHESKNPIDAIYAKALLLRIIHFYFSECEFVKINDVPNQTVMGKLVKYIDENLERKITLTELAKFAHLNANYLCTLFSSTFGQTPIEYITNKKIEKAKILLRTTTDTIEEISNTLGFSSPFYFSAVFKKRIGYSPSQFRQSRMGK
ncbi:AraC family transcriptional regulator [Candidatus Epulonipiscium viviparus]|uniref:AraC family transcriptional regulator n=1 Tax=Candidatus Epulonipiscium viviparus TaxID=420336 RepID=UPI00016C01F8|nr:AraC family transcriptional regulator [Candidatus Epulopiscium viviparus]